MTLENIIRHDIESVNKGIIKKRKNLKELLQDPKINGIEINEKCLKWIAERCTLPLDEILLPITFFVPAGIDEGYVQIKNDARVVEIFNVDVAERNGLYWVKKYKIRKLVRDYPGCFQMIVLP